MKKNMFGAGAPILFGARAPHHDMSTILIYFFFLFLFLNIWWIISFVPPRVISVIKYEREIYAWQRYYFRSKVRSASYNTKIPTLDDFSWALSPISYALWCNQIGTVKKNWHFSWAYNLWTTYLEDKIITFARHEYGRVGIFRIKMWSLVQSYSLSKSVNFQTVPIWLYHTVYNPLSLQFWNF